MDMNSIERIEEYCHDIPQEQYYPTRNNHNNSHHGHNTTSTSTTTTTMSPTTLLSTLLHYPSHPNPTTSPTINTTNSASNSNWPSVGRVEFRGISMRYPSSPTAVLHNVSFTLQPGQKVGVVGRTGAGKSSLIVALFRMVEPSGGEIVIDGQNVLQLPLATLRQGIAIVPQEPTLFTGTLRFNLDPFHQFSDEELWLALRRVRLDHYCQSLLLSLQQQQQQQQDSNKNLSHHNSHSQGHNANNGKNGEAEEKKNCNAVIRDDLENILVAEKGSNFSVGQRQLLCMARALLRYVLLLIL